MRVLVVTAQLAAEVVKQQVKSSNVDCDVLVLPRPVAALLNTSYIARKLREEDVKCYDMILLPGLCFGDLDVVEKAVGVPVYKGPKYAADLPAVLNMLGSITLSKTIPACELLSNRLRVEAETYIREREEGALKAGGEGRIEVGGLVVGFGLPIRVMAEIVDAPLLSEEEILKRATYYISSGADIIDVGMVARESRPEDAGKIVKLLKRHINKPVSIDTLDVNECEEAVKAGVDLILSFDRGALEEASKFAKETASVIIPSHTEAGYFPKEPEERVRALRENLKLARALGMSKVIADPITDALIIPGLVHSLVAHYLFRREEPYTPLFMGLANVSELLDADSIGVNALLAGLAMELGASIVLATEASVKTRGAVRELAKACKMMYIAYCRGSVPKDLGLDLLVLKEKRLRDDPLIQVGERCGRVQADGEESVYMDERGSFKIAVDRENSQIVVYHYPRSLKEVDVVIYGREASKIVKKIIDLGLVSRLDHAAYLGRELQKAEIALKTGKGYIQDSELF
jgi:dihydropteroate synthase-like protein